MSEKFDLSRRKILAGLGTIGVAGAGAGAGTTALYSDEETFNNNTIQAGTTNLIVEAAVAARGSGLQNSDGDVVISSSDGQVDGAAEVGITATDIKPGDKFVVGFDVTVQDNPMYVALQASNLSDSENVNPEPESTGTDPDNGGDNLSGQGDLDNRSNVVIGYDTSANDFTWDQSGAVAPTNAELGTSGGQAMNTFLDNLANNGFLYEDGASVPVGHGNETPTELGGGSNVTHWVYVEVPASVGNEIMGDSVSFDLTWYGEQVRNNSPPSGPSDVIDGSTN